MKPWESLKHIFKGELPERGANPVFLLRLLSFEKSFISICDQLNYFYPLSEEQWLKLIVVSFSGKKNRYINYIKRKAQDDQLFMVFKQRIKDLFSWSNREFGYAFEILAKNLNNDILHKLGFEEKEQEKLFKIIKEKL